MAARLVQRTMQLQNPKAFSVIVVIVAMVVIIAVVVVAAVAVGGEILLATCLSSCTFQTNGRADGASEKRQKEREGGFGRQLRQANTLHKMKCNKRKYIFGLRTFNCQAAYQKRKKMHESKSK